MILSVLVTAFVTVFLAELVGDKNMLMVASLGTRGKRLFLLGGILFAVAIKMGVAVLFGNLLQQVPKSITAIVTGLTFVAAALLIAFEREAETKAAIGDKNPVTLALTAILLSEWCDPGQLATAALTAKYQAPLTIWLAATCAVFVKFSLALLVGSTLAERVPAVPFRYAMACVLLLAGAASLFTAIA